MEDLIISDSAGKELFRTFNQPANKPQLQEVDYYKIDRISHSRMTNFRQSPRHYIYSLTHFEETPALVLGRAFHCLALEPDLFHEQFFTIDTSKRDDLDHGMTSKANKLWKHTQIVHNQGRSLLTEDQTETVKRMVEALYNCPPARELLDVITEVEKPLFWTDPETGIEIKSKIDGLNPELTIDLKSCMNAKPSVFGRHAFDMEYHGQAGLYTEGRHENKMKRGDYYLIACEKEPPYGVSVNKASRDFLRVGRMLNTTTLEDFAYWREMGAPDVCYEWRRPFGYALMDVPYWAK